MEIKKENLPWIKVGNEWFTTYLGQISESTLSIYTTLKIHSSRDNFLILNMNYLMSLFDIKVTSRKSITSLKKSLQFLKETNQIEFYESFFNRNLIDVNLDKVGINETLFIKVLDPQGTFTCIYVHEIQTILGYNQLEMRYRRQLLNYFLAICYHINNETKVCYPKLETLSLRSGIGSRTTCIKYNEILKDELKLIILDNARIVFKEKDIAISTSTIYARPQHEEYLKSAVSASLDSCKTQAISMSKKKDKNRRISLKQKMNWLDKKRDLEGLALEEKAMYIEYQLEHEELSKNKTSKKEDLIDKEPVTDPYNPDNDIEVVFDADRGFKMAYDNQTGRGRITPYNDDGNW